MKVMSIGFFVEEDAAVVWRGPMLHKALTQFLQDVEWGALDYLLVDLPPGHRRRLDDARPAAAAGAFVIVTTPAGDRAEGRAPRGPDGRTRSRSRSAGWSRTCPASRRPPASASRSSARAAAQELADELDVPLLGKVPLTMPLREHADSGVPLVIEDPDDPAAQAIRHVARGLDRDGAAAPADAAVARGPRQPPPRRAESRKPVGMSLPMA